MCRLKPTSPRFQARDRTSHSLCSGSLSRAGGTSILSIGHRDHGSRSLSLLMSELFPARSGPSKARTLPMLDRRLVGGPLVVLLPLVVVRPHEAVRVAVPQHERRVHQVVEDGHDLAHRRLAVRAGAVPRLLDPHRLLALAA